ncbi:hypothetical protein FNH22_30640 [Fulvivirga sp. M361]|uniref:hypothetical protein n=1 Tax=Fulvivirga sp. M361 TaxID=2594266 RepID=UPI00117B8FFA|nr:hypothetical protein [Fulvivirga sp. M361]TRX47056.1 hypothetical protein FNH22_30640 [Fulvivirga sp. M361]
MNKYFLVFFLVYSVSDIYSQAQFGLKTGVNLSTHTLKINGENYPDVTSYLLGYQIGTWMSNSVSQKYNLITELSYSAEGFKYDIGNNRLGFLLINTSVNYKLGDRFIIGLGPEFSAIINENLVLNGHYKKLGFGGNLNVFYNLINDLSIGLRYHRGFHDISDLVFEVGPDRIMIYDETKGNFQINLYYRLGKNNVESNN